MTPVQIIEAVGPELEATGYEVRYSDGWQTRGRPGDFFPHGLVFHHTADRGYGQDYSILDLIINGRSDLPGPLAQFGLGRSGRVYVIAAGKANHAGGGGWNGLTGNYSVWGIEAANDGIGEPWPDTQVDAYLALAASLARHTGFGPEMVCRHAEWSDAGKIDTATAPLDDGEWIRAQVASRLNPQPSIKELPMEFTYIANGEDWVVSTSAGFLGRLPYGETLDGLKDSKQLANLGQQSANFHLGMVEFANQCEFRGSR